MADAVSLADLSECPGRVLEWLARSRVAEPHRGLRALQSIVSVMGEGDAARRLLEQISRTLARVPDPDRGLTNFDRLISAVLGHCAHEFLVGDLVRWADKFLWVVGASQYIADQLVSDPLLAEWLVRHAREPFPAGQLQQELRETLEAEGNEETVLRVLRRTRHRHIVRIGFGDLVLGFPLDRVFLDLSDLADALVQAALEWSIARAVETYGVPRTGDGDSGRICVLGMGKLGGQELNYSSDIDLILFYDADGFTDGERQISCEEFWRRVVARMLRLLTSYTADGYVYRVDLRLRPDGRVGAMVRSLNSMLAYYQTVARTWELQAMIKARPCAGDIGLGRRFLAALEPLVYRRYLSAEQIAEIKVIKKRIEERSTVTDGLPRDVKLSSGGIRDVEFVVQFLQLLHGAALPNLRERNTIRALRALEQAGCLTGQERESLETSYRFLRNVEHRLQLFADRQTHEIPEDSAELAVLARKLGYDGDDAAVLKEFRRDLRRVTSENRRILSYLLQDAFRGSGEEVVAPESELVLDPEPDSETVMGVLGQYGFEDPLAIHRLLQRLAAEPVPFLSSLRCRHQMAAIAPTLLRAVKRYSNPDRTLARLEVASQAMGARGALWELFRVHPEAMRVTLDICAYAEMLYQMLCCSPGMFDDLVDALELRMLPDAGELDAELSELLTGAKDQLPILYNFKAGYEFRAGVRLLMGKERGINTARLLRNLALVLIVRLGEYAVRSLARRYGHPLVARRRRASACRWAVVIGGPLAWGVGAFLDPVQFVVIYEGDGVTHHETRRRGWEPTTNQHFFHEVARLVTAASGAPHYPVLRLQPGWSFETRSTVLAFTLEQAAEAFNVEGARHPEWWWFGVAGPDRRFTSVVEEQLRRGRLAAELPLPRTTERPIELLEGLLGRMAYEFRNERRWPRDPWDALRRRGEGLFGQARMAKILKSAQFLVEFRQFGQLVSARAGEPVLDEHLAGLLQSRPWLEKDLANRELASVLEEHVGALRDELAHSVSEASGTAARMVGETDQGGGIPSR